MYLVLSNYLVIQHCGYPSVDQCTRIEHVTTISSTAWGFYSFLQLRILPVIPLQATKNRINIKQQQWSTRLITPIKYRESSNHTSTSNIHKPSCWTYVCYVS